MVIAVNTRLLQKGIPADYSNYIYETFSRIAQTHPEHQFIYIFDGTYSPDLVFSENITPIILLPETRNGMLQWWWFNFRVPKILKKYKADVFVSPDGYCSGRTRVPQILMTGHNVAIRSCLRKAEAIITTSEFSKKQLIAQYKTSEEKTYVVHPGVSELFVPVGTAEREKTKEKYAAGHEYFICSGDIFPEQNLIHLLKAFSLFKKRQKSGMQLLIAPASPRRDDNFHESLRLFKYRDDVKYMGSYDKQELAEITASAYAMVYPSSFEGYVITPLEAMRCGVPVLSSNTVAMPELCGEAAEYFNPAEPADIAQKMMLIYKDEELRRTMISKGHQHVLDYNRDKTAENLWQVVTFGQ